MGKVIDNLINMIMEQIDKHGIVVWFDPQQYYGEVINEIVKLARIPVFTYDGSFIALRRAVDSKLEQVMPPKILIYLPMSSEDSGFALQELVAAGIVMRPGQQPPSRNTRIAVVARRVLSEVVKEKDAEELAIQAEKGRLTLRDLDLLAEGKATESKVGLLSLIYGTSKPEEIALAFLCYRKKDVVVKERQAFAELCDLFSSFLGLHSDASSEIEELRKDLACHLLMAEFISSLGDNIPPALQKIQLPQEKQLEECRKLTDAWRKRRDLSEEYLIQADRLENEFSFAKMEISPLVLEKLETFRFVEERMQEKIEQEMLQHFRPELIIKAENRLSSFWADHYAPFRARWVLISTAGKIINKSCQLVRALQERKYSFMELLEQYVSGDEPWCLLDRSHRMMETFYQAFEYGAGASNYSSLERLVVKARQEYFKATNIFSEFFVEAFHQENFNSAGHYQQRNIFRHTVVPLFEEGKTAFFMVDALRYEMGWELAKLLEQETNVSLSFALAAVPTTTAIGMAALLPGAEDEDVKYIPEVKKGLFLKVGDCVLKRKKDRMNLLRSRIGKKIHETALELLLPPSKKEREIIKEAEFIVVTSREIDQFSEMDNVSMARKIMKEMVGELKRAVLTLQNLGVKNIVIAADHGFILNEEVGDDMKIDPPGGEDIELHRRVWVGYGGENRPGCLRFKPFFGVSQDDFDLVAPMNLAVFRTKSGSLTYFHGGISPQEMIIPVITVTKLLEEPSLQYADVEWILTPGSKKITTRFISLQVSGNLQNIAMEDTIKVKVELRDKNKVVSQAVSASYGFSEVTEEVELKINKEKREIETNKITLLVEGIEKGAVRAYLIDFKTGKELARTEDIQVIISI